MTKASIDKPITAVKDDPPNLKMPPVPPQDFAAEGALVGAIIWRRDTTNSDAEFNLANVRAIVSPAMFYAVPDYGKVYQAILDTEDAGEPSYDDAVVLGRLNGQGPEGGWGETMRDLGAVAGNPANALIYARRIRECWRRRETIQRCDQAKEKAYSLLPDVNAGAVIDGLVDDLKAIGAESAGGRVVRRMSRVTPRPVWWLWQNRFAVGKLSLIIGMQGLGKSFLSLDMAARLSRGTPWPDRPREPNDIGDTLILSAEDDPEDTIHERLSNSGADLDRIHVFDGIQRSADPDAVDLFNLQADLPHLRDELEHNDRIRLVIIDPLTSYLGDCDAHKDAEVRRILAPVVKLARDYKVAVIGIMHRRKSGTDIGAGIFSASGSVGFTACARAVYFVLRDPEDPATPRRLLLEGKSNLRKTTDPEGLAFTIAPPGCIAWEADPVATLLDDALTPPKRKPRTARNDAGDWLKDLLKDGPVLATEVAEGAKQSAISKNTLQRVKADLGVVSRKRKVEDITVWYWLFPEQETQSGHVQNSGDLGVLGTLECNKKPNIPNTPTNLDVPPLGPLVGTVEDGKTAKPVSCSVGQT